MTLTVWYVLVTHMVWIVLGSEPYLQVVGSPANWWTHVQSWSIHQNLNVQPSTSPHFMTEDMWTNLIAAEVLKQCDALDGVRPSIFHQQAFPLNSVLPARRRNRQRPEELRVCAPAIFVSHVTEYRSFPQLPSRNIVVQLRPERVDLLD